MKPCDTLDKGRPCPSPARWAARVSCTAGHVKWENLCDECLVLLRDDQLACECGRNSKLGNLR